MKIGAVIIFIFLVFSTVFGIALGSAAVECYNKNTAFKVTKSKNFTFLMWGIGLQVIFAVFGGLGLLIPV